MTAAVNGRVLSRGNAASMHWTWPQLLAHASRDATLRPGDVLGSGTVGTGCILELTPEAVGGWLKPGDVVELTIERLGTLAQPRRRRILDSDPDPESDLMPPYLRLGSIPRKRHIAHPNVPGFKGEGIYYEEVVTVAGFSRAYSIVYHLRPPTRVLQGRAGRDDRERPGRRPDAPPSSPEDAGHPPRGRPDLRPGPPARQRRRDPGAVPARAAPG